MKFKFVQRIALRYKLYAYPKIALRLPKDAKRLPQNPYKYQKR